MREAIEFHIEGLRHEGYNIPSPNSYSTYVDVLPNPRLKTDAESARLADHFFDTTKMDRF
jgi:biotin operon repressor